MSTAIWTSPPVSHDPLDQSPAPLSALRNAFRIDVTRTQRKDDGTITLDGVRFEIPSRFRHFRKLTVRYARWDLRNVHVVDPKTNALKRLSYLSREKKWSPPWLWRAPPQPAATPGSAPGVDSHVEYELGADKTDRRVAHLRWMGHPAKRTVLVRVSYTS